MSSDQFERKLQERFAQAEIQPSAALWDRIEADMAPGPSGKKRFLWLWWSLAGLLFLSVGLAWVWQPEAGPAASVQSIAFPDVAQQETSIPPTIPQNSEQQPNEIARVRPDQADVSASSESTYSDNSQASEAQTPPSVASAFGNQENQAIVQIDLSSQKPEIHSAPTKQNSVDTSSDFNSSDLPKKVQAWEVNSILSFLPPQELKVGKLTFVSPGLVNSDLLSPGGKWSFDMGIKSGYAFGLSSAFRIDEEKSISADYAGLANRSSYSGIPTGQVATVLFPRVHHAISLEAGRILGTRWRVSMGVEGKIGFGGVTTLGELDQSYDIPPGGSAGDPVIVVEESNINFSSPNQFDHYTLSLPLRLSYLTSWGRGTLENSAGISLNRSWTYIASQSTVESFAFQLSTDAQSSYEGLALPDPVLQSNAWHSDLRLRSRYVFSNNRHLQPFIGAELQAQVHPAFSGDASTNQRPILLGLELGIRFR